MEPLYNIYTNGDETENYIVFHPNLPKWLLFNRTAFDIAERIKNNESIESAANYLIQKYGIIEKTAKKDVNLVFNELEEKGFINKQKIVSNYRKPSLESLYLHLTNRCNLSCHQCYAASKDNHTKELPYDLVISLIDELILAGGKQITFSGGEPLLHNDIKKIIEYASKKLKIKLLTNGLLLDKEFVSFLSDKPVNIQISIDGSNSLVHDSIRGEQTFDKALKNIEYIKKADILNRINIAATIMKQNKNDLINIIGLAEKLGIPLVRFQPLRRIGRAGLMWDSISGMNLESYEKFFQKILDICANKETTVEITCGLSGFLLNMPEHTCSDDIWCPIGKNIIVSFNGDTFPCILLMNNEFRIGSIFTETLSQMINSDKMKNICYALLNRRNKILKCSKCSFRNFCQAGCMGQANDYTETIWDTDQFCSFRQKAYQNAFNKILKLNEK